MSAHALAGNMPTLLVLGANGQVGWELVRCLQVLGDVQAPNRDALKLDDARAIEAWVARERPTVIVNAAAWTAVDEAERQFEAAWEVNAQAPGRLAEVARRHDALLLHYSTDYVFDGSGTQAWREQDPVGPINAYGRGKLAGEQAIAAVGGDWLVLRTSWVFASRGRNFVRTMLKLGAEREALRIVADQIGAPTSARLIADATAQIVAQALRERQQSRFQSEVLHLCAGGETSWHGLACAIFDSWHTLAPAQKLAVREVVAIGSSDYPTPARRPQNSRLDCTRLQTRFGLNLPDWRHGLKLVLAELAEHPGATSDRPVSR